MMVAIPELDGAIWPMTFGGRSGRRTRRRPARATWSAHRGARRRCWRRASRSWWRCAAPRVPSARSRSCCSTSRPTPARPARRPISSVFASLHQHAARAADGGLQGRCAARRSMRCATRIIDGNAARFGADANVAARIPVDDHVRRQRWLRRDRGAMGPGARAAPKRRRSICSCSARSSAMCSSASSPPSATRATRCGCCSSTASRRPTPSAAFYRWIARGFRRRTRCCISAPMARWSSCPASRPACPATAGRTG